jgi:hypothetical protein
VKRILALTSLWLFAVVAIAQAPIGVCLNNVAQTISNGVIAPIPYATVALCTAGSTASNCIANKVNIFTSTALSTATPTNPFTADAGGNYFFCAAVGHYGVLISSSYGTFFVNDVALVDDWSKGGTMTGALTDTSGFIGPLTGNVTGNVSGNAGTASALASTPTACNPASYFAYGISANGNALCNALPTPATLYYQTVQEAGTALTQQPVLNFDGTVVGSNGTGNTNVGLPSVGTAGTYANPSSLTKDSQGRVTAITAAPFSQAEVSASRVVGSVYTAGSNPEIVEVTFSAQTVGNCTGAWVWTNAQVGASAGASPSLTAAASGEFNSCDGIWSMTFFVPAGFKYQVNETTLGGGTPPGTISIVNWIEVTF